MFKYFKILLDVIYIKKWYIVTLILIYALNLDDLLDPQIDGPEFAITAIFFEMVMVATILIAKKNYGKNVKQEVSLLKQKLVSLNQEQDTVEYITTTRKIKKLSKLRTSMYTPEICSFIRYTLPYCLFSHKFICIFPNNYFWFPMESIVSYPHCTTKKELKIGFFFFWKTLTVLDDFIINYFL